jgi:hypothetical protein
MSAFRMRVHWSYPYWRNIWHTLQLFSRFLAIKKYSCIGMLSIAIFYIPRWRYLHITLDHIFSCCVSCNGLSIGIITIYLWNSLGNIFHQSLWKLKFKRTKQTETFFYRAGELPEPRSDRGSGDFRVSKRVSLGPPSLREV